MGLSTTVTSSTCTSTSLGKRSFNVVTVDENTKDNVEVEEIVMKRSTHISYTPIGDIAKITTDNIATNDTVAMTSGQKEKVEEEEDSLPDIDIEAEPDI